MIIGLLFAMVYKYSYRLLITFLSLILIVNVFRLGRFLVAFTDLFIVESLSALSIVCLLNLTFMHTSIGLCMFRHMVWLFCSLLFLPGGRGLACAGAPVLGGCVERSLRFLGSSCGKYQLKALLVVYHGGLHCVRLTLLVEVLNICGNYLDQ